MEIKPLITEWWMCQRRNQEKQKVSGTKWKQKHNTTKFLGHIWSSPAGKFIVLGAYIKIIWAQTNDLAMQLENLRNKNKSNPKPVNSKK